MHRIHTCALTPIEDITCIDKKHNDTLGVCVHASTCTLIHSHMLTTTPIHTNIQEPFERFQFVITDRASAKLVITM
jgi:hypothetical protein